MNYQKKYNYADFNAILRTKYFLLLYKVSPILVMVLPKANKGLEEPVRTTQIFSIESWWKITLCQTVHLALRTSVPWLNKFPILNVIRIPWKVNNIVRLLFSMWKAMSPLSNLNSTITPRINVSKAILSYYNWTITNKNHEKKILNANMSRKRQ